MKFHFDYSIKEYILTKTWDIFGDLTTFGICHNSLISVNSAQVIWGGGAQLVQSPNFHLLIMLFKQCT